VAQDAFPKSLLYLPRTGKPLIGNPHPRHPVTKAPRMDPTIQSRMMPAAKAVDRNLQRCVLDAASFW